MAKKKQQADKKDYKASNEKMLVAVSAARLAECIGKEIERIAEIAGISKYEARLIMYEAQVINLRVTEKLKELFTSAPSTPSCEGTK